MNIMVCAITHVSENTCFRVTTFRKLSLVRFITLRACPPTRIYAPCFLDSRLVIPTLPGHRAKGPNKGPKGPKGTGPKGGFGALGGVRRPWGVIPKPFRMESPFKWRVTMKVNHSEMKAVANGSWNDAQMIPCGLGHEIIKKLYQH